MQLVLPGLFACEHCQPGLGILECFVLSTQMIFSVLVSLTTLEILQHFTSECTPMIFFNVKCFNSVSSLPPQGCYLFSDMWQMYSVTSQPWGEESGSGKPLKSLNGESLPVSFPHFPPSVFLLSMFLQWVVICLPSFSPNKPLPFWSKCMPILPGTWTCHFCG